MLIRVHPALEVGLKPCRNPRTRCHFWTRLAKKPTVTTVGHEQGTIAALWSQQRHFWGGGARGRVTRQCGPAAAPDHRALPRVPYGCHVLQGEAPRGPGGAASPALVPFPPGLHARRRAGPAARGGAGRSARLSPAGPPGGIGGPFCLRDAVAAGIKRPLSIKSWLQCHERCNGRFKRSRGGNNTHDCQDFGTRQPHRRPSTWNSRHPHFAWA